MDLRERLRFARWQAGYRGHGSLARFCRDTGIRENTMWCYENGKYNPGARRLATIARVTGCDLLWLVTGDEKGQKSVPAP